MTTQVDNQAGKRKHKFHVGQRVKLTNPAGLVFHGKIIIGKVHNPVRGACYYITPTDTPWFDFSEAELSPEQNGGENIC